MPEFNFDFITGCLALVCLVLGFIYLILELGEEMTARKAFITAGISLPLVIWFWYAYSKSPNMDSWITPYLPLPIITTVLCIWQIARAFQMTRLPSAGRISHAIYAVPFVFAVAALGMLPQGFPAYTY